jgi:conjugal transfer pilin signal peptidase TrbI
MTAVTPTGAQRRVTARAILIAFAALVNIAWSGWATHSLLELRDRRIVTVQLGKVMGEFVEAEARSGRDPEAMRARVATYLNATQVAVAELGKDGTTVLVAEAVVAGGAPDMTDAVRAKVAKLVGGSDARR